MIHQLTLTKKIYPLLLTMIMYCLTFCSSVSVQGETINGRIIQRSTRNAKQYVRIEISGPSGSFTRFTDENGFFDVELNERGIHTIRVVDGYNVKEFRINIAGDNQVVNRNFEVPF